MESACAVDKAQGRGAGRKSQRLEMWDGFSTMDSSLRLRTRPNTSYKPCFILSVDRSSARKQSKDRIRPVSKSNYTQTNKQNKDISPDSVQLTQHQQQREEGYNHRVIALLQVGFHLSRLIAGRWRPRRKHKCSLKCQHLLWCTIKPGSGSREFTFHHWQHNLCPKDILHFCHVCMVYST